MYSRFASFLRSEDGIRPNAIFSKCNRTILHQIGYGRFRWAVVAVEKLVNSALRQCGPSQEREHTIAGHRREDQKSMKSR